MGEEVWGLKSTITSYRIANGDAKDSTENGVAKEPTCDPWT